MIDDAPFRFTYDLQQHGWALVTVQAGDRVVPMHVSYLSDALRDLLDAVRALAEGALETQAVLWEEPGEWQWTFRREGHYADVEIRSMDGNHSKGRHVVTLRTPVVDLAAQVSGESGRLLRELGEGGYLERWQLYPFPAEAHARLAAWVGATS